MILVTSKKKGPPFQRKRAVEVLCRVLRCKGHLILNLSKYKKKQSIRWCQSIAFFFVFILQVVSPKCCGGRPFCGLLFFLRWKKYPKIPLFFFVRRWKFPTTLDDACCAADWGAGWWQGVDKLIPHRNKRCQPKNHRFFHVEVDPNLYERFPASCEKRSAIYNFTRLEIQIMYKSST